MIHLVFGGSGSGKSAFAEKAVMELNCRTKIYLATMKVYGQEGLEKVKRHQRLRASKGFFTVEAPCSIFESLKSFLEKTCSNDSETFGQQETSGNVVLLECLSNLVANEMFRDGEIVPEEQVVERIEHDLKNVMTLAENLVVVSGNVFEDGIEYDEATRRYMKALAEITDFIAERADRVTEVVVGIPVLVK